uniref:Uncharacterized protein n=1 Tax=Rhizophora mucronata TaxID=61149 RepID=A0A2P2J4J5_RHIMU
MPTKTHQPPCNLVALAYYNLPAQPYPIIQDSQYYHLPPH